MLTEITIPDSVTTIGNQTFDNCSNLTSITIPDSVTYIGNLAFRDTPWLENKRNENPLVIVNDILIDGTTCSGDVVIPEGVTSIGGEAFDSCKDLTSITIPNSVKSIGDWAFEICSSLTEITIPESVTSIGYSAFHNTPWLENKQKENPLVIVNYILIDGTTCSGDVVIPDSVTSISEGAFDGCKGLISITIPNSVKSIGDSAFRSCSSLTEITIPNSVTSIGGVAFGWCSSLTSITIENPDCEINDDPDTILNCYDEEHAEKYDKKFESLGEAPVTEFAMGDVNGDKTVDSSDATVILADYALTSTGKESNLTAAQKAAADVDKDGKIDSSDASIILQFYAYVSTGGTETDMSKWLAK